METDCYHCQKLFKIEHGENGECPHCQKKYFWGDFEDDDGTIHESCVLDWEETKT